LDAIRNPRPQLAAHAAAAVAARTPCFEDRLTCRYVLRQGRSSAEKQASACNDERRNFHEVLSRSVQ
jgi:hypothetical protein